MKKLSRSFYQRKDVVSIAKELIGKKLCTFIDGKRTSGIIVETEAYSGKNDRACHANNGKRTKRTEVMFGQGGLAYVYLCYGIHHLFNIVCNERARADAILIRAIQPDEGMELMLRRRGFPKNQNRIGAGPGCVSQALGIDLNHYGADLTGSTIWIETGIDFEAIESGPRIGVDYAGADALLPWRFYVKGNPFVSR